MPSEPFVAEIIITPFNFPPRGFAFCGGQLLPISQNTALFSLLGTNYGGDGKSTFGLPNLQGRAAIHPGQGPGLSLRDLGELGGESTVSLTTAEIPPHNHSADVNIPVGEAADTDSPVNAYPATFDDSDQVNGNDALLYGDGTENESGSVTSKIMGGPAGDGQPHNNYQNTLTLNYCIALQGVFPSRS